MRERTLFVGAPAPFIISFDETLHSAEKLRSAMRKMAPMP
jgi:hypothetical protein